MEFSFISPIVGIRYRQELQQIANQIGWRIQIADKVNQNALFQMIRTLCAEHEITLAKNPSYLPDKKVIAVKIAKEVDNERQAAIANAFLEKTGCACEFV